MTGSPQANQLTYANAVSPRAVTVMLSDGRVFVRPSEHPLYLKAKEAVERNAPVDEIIAIMDTVAALTEQMAKVGEVEVTRDGVVYKGKPIHMTVTDRIMEFQKGGHDVTFLLSFLDNLLKNPYRESVLSMYEFLEKNRVPITADGCFYAYKKVRDDYTDIHTGTFDNSVGQKPSVEGWEVDPDRTHECSRGLHVCAPQYLPSFGSGPGNRVMVCKVNPKDVYAIPRDYNLSKMRCTTYEVVAELNDQQKADILFKTNPTMKPGDASDDIKWGDQYVEDEDENRDECWDCGNDQDDCCCHDDEPLQGDPGDEVPY